MMPDKEVKDTVINRSNLGQSSVGSIILNVDKGDKEQSRACSFCHNQLSDRNISLVCEECEGKFCVLCEASFRRGIQRRAGEPVLCRKCHKAAEQAKVNGIKESWRSSLDKREAELNAREQLVSDGQATFQHYCDAKQQELAIKEQELARRQSQARSAPVNKTGNQGAPFAISLILGSAGVTMVTAIVGELGILPLLLLSTRTMSRKVPAPVTPNPHVKGESS